MDVHFRGDRGDRSCRSDGSKLKQVGLIGRQSLPRLAGVCVAFVLGVALPAMGQTTGWEWNTKVREVLPQQGEALPVHVSGQSIERISEDAVVIKGSAELRRLGLIVQADQIDHDSKTQQLLAQGDVRVLEGEDRYSGTKLDVNLDSKEGVFDALRYELGSGARGDAKRMVFQGPNQSEAQTVRYSTCPRPDAEDWRPDWVLNASSVSFDRAQQVGTAYGAVVRFKDLPILASPWLQFPLTEERMSGWLTPALSLSDVSGVEVTTPYYFNLAPNYDATLYPNYLSKRGLNMGAETRYLWSEGSGQIRLDYMPEDRLRGSSRLGGSWQHSQDVRISDRLWRFSLDANQVSDDNYWRDFPSAINTLSTRQLPTTFVASTGAENWQFSAGAYQWQTLQEPDQITPAYDRLPELKWSWQPHWLSDWTMAFSSELTRFNTDSTVVENGQRWLGEASVSRRWNTNSGFVEPALRLQGRHYALERPTGRAGEWGQARRISLSVPTASVDAGLVFERDLSGGALQTLEPRALFAYTPTVLQSGLPVYDAALKDFNFSSIFSPLEYSGNDRVADNQSLTLGATSRWLRASGREWLSVSAAQKIRRKAMVVTLTDGQPAAAGLSDWLLGGTWSESDRWTARGFAQYDDTERVLRRSTASLRYHAGAAQHVQVSYTFQRDSSELIDLSWQYPLLGKAASPSNLGQAAWYSVGRTNYSVKDRRMVNLLLGAEYDAGCWVGRVAIERTQDSASSATHRLFFQLELSGFGSLGSGSIATLRDNIPDYSALRQQTVPVSRFANYE